MKVLLTAVLVVFSVSAIAQSKNASLPNIRPGNYKLLLGSHSWCDSSVSPEVGYVEGKIAVTLGSRLGFISERVIDEDRGGGCVNKTESATVIRGNETLHTTTRIAVCSDRRKEDSSIEQFTFDSAAGTIAYLHAELSPRDPNGGRNPVPGSEIKCRLVSVAGLMSLGVPLAEPVLSPRSPQPVD